MFRARPFLLATVVCGALGMPAGAAHLVQGSGRPDVRWSGDSSRATVRWQGREVAIRVPEGGEVGEVGGYGERWFAAGTADGEGGRRLMLLSGDSATAGELPVPFSRAIVQRRPVVLASRDELLGLAWLEGDSAGALGVRAAEWNDGRWSPAVWVSRPSAGSQMGLTGAVLADGSWLLLWSAFDGEDDEIVAARRVSGTWDSPKRIGPGNRVPDITPAVTASGNGALAAWSRFADGSYRLEQARFDGKTWRLLAPAPDRRALYPAFRAFDDATVLLFLDARQDGWTALELDRQGRVRRRSAAVARGTSEAPIVDAVESGLRWRWPGAREAESRWTTQP